MFAAFFKNWSLIKSDQGQENTLDCIEDIETGVVEGETTEANRDPFLTQPVWITQTFTHQARAAETRVKVMDHCFYRSQSILSNHKNPVKLKKKEMMAASNVPKLVVSTVPAA